MRTVTRGAYSYDGNCNNPARLVVFLVGYINETQTKDKEMKTYENLNDLLEGDTMWRFGRSLYKYTDCGPWTVFHFKNGGTLYYGDPLAHKGDWSKLRYWKNSLIHTVVKWWKGFRHVNCTSVEIGSIVEGSDVEITGRHLEFPFTSEQLDATVKGVNDEASFYWKRDNTREYCDDSTY